MHTSSFNQQGMVKDISDLIKIEKKTGGYVFKKVLTLVLSHNETVFIDVVNAKLNLLNELNIKPGDVVFVSCSFSGSIKNNSFYNNIFLQHIQVL